jgi:aerobic-type carbon monoxide dehydrogenase small subunit (CoxS/CutS family)
VEGCSVITIEGASKTRTGRALQNAFVEHGGAQCGICTPGMILAAAPLKPSDSLDTIKTALAGNLCRCTGYPAIFRSVESALAPAHATKKSAARSAKKGRRAVRA